MISSNYIDITELRNFFQNNFDESFNKNYVTKKYLRYGLNTGLMKTGNIEPLYAAVSHVQYISKGLKKPVITWWYIQHIIVAYIRASIQRSEILNSSNFNSFVQGLRMIKTDQGQIAFKESDIIQVLSIIQNSDSIFQNIIKTPLVIIKQPESVIVKPVEPVVIPDNKTIEINKPEEKTPVIIPGKAESNMSMYLIGGVGALVGLMLMKNKKGKKKRR